MSARAQLPADEELTPRCRTPTANGMYMGANVVLESCMQTHVRVLLLHLHPALSMHNTAWLLCGKTDQQTLLAAAAGCVVDI